VDKSRVVIAGLTIGEITGRALDGRYARVTIRIRKETQVWSNATILKKSSSLLGEYYLEIDPGTPQIMDEKGNMVANRLLQDGDEIPNSVEGTGTQELMTSVNRILPHVDEVLLEVRNLAADTRDLINGPVTNMADNLDRAVAQDTILIHSILDRTDKIASDIREVTKAKGPEVDRILNNIEKASKQLNDLLETTKKEVTATGGDLRQKIDRVDAILDDVKATTENTKSITKKVDSDDQGTLGKLVNDPTIADNVEQITEDVRGFTHSLFGLQTIVGLRTEYNFMAQISRSYFSVEIYPRPDKFYLIELVSDPRGSISTSFTVDPNQQLVRYQTIQYPGFQFTLQYGKKFDWLTLRLGIKQSSGGVGLDLNLPGGFQIQSDIFEFTFNAAPRLRLALAYHFFRYLYVVAGIDDVLNNSKYVDISGNDLSGNSATQYYFGRDPFLGVMIRFNDEDLRSLLFVGGSALSAAFK
jgi:phospholipid/cholesterol/gamma-HCH transport system substrate-binding protein